MGQFFYTSARLEDFENATHAQRMQYSQVTTDFVQRNLGTVIEEVYMETEGTLMHYIFKVPTYKKEFNTVFYTVQQQAKNAGFILSDVAEFPKDVENNPNIRRVQL